VVVLVGGKKKQRSLVHRIGTAAAERCDADSRLSFLTVRIDWLFVALVC